MSSPSWRIDVSDPHEMTTVPGGLGLVSLHFMRSALRRQWRTWVGWGCAGLLLGAAWALLVPAKEVATVSLMLAHDPANDPAQSMATDTSLLRTGTLATKVIRELDLDMSPFEFQGAVATQPVSTSVLTLEVSGPDEGAAVLRARTLSDRFLEFRASQILSQTRALTNGYQQRIAALKHESEELGKQYETLHDANAGDTAEGSALLNKLSQVGTESEAAQQAIEDASLKADSIIAASYVLDPAAPKPDRSPLKRMLLAMAGGLAAGSAIGVILVLLRALTSDRLRLREEIALALDAPVRVSVGHVRRSRSPWHPRSGAAAARAVQLLVHALYEEIPRTQFVRTTGKSRNSRAGEATRRAHSTRMAVAAVDNIADAQVVVVDLASRLSKEGLSVFVVDLTEAGALGTTLDAALQQQEVPSSFREPVVHRPDGVPALARGPLGRSAAMTSDLPMTHPQRSAWDKADVALTLVEVDPAVGVEHVRSWAEQVVVLVTAGHSSAERLSTVAELIRSVGLRLLFAMLVGADRTDDSLGVPSPPASSDSPHASRASR